MAKRIPKKTQVPRKKIMNFTEVQGFVHPLGFTIIDDRRPTNAVKISSLVPNIFVKYGIGRRLGMARFEKVWEEICSGILLEVASLKKLEERIRLVSFRGGVIRLEVTGYSMLQELTFYRQAILKMFQARLPDEKIREVRLTIKS